MEGHSGPTAPNATPASPANPRPRSVPEAPSWSPTLLGGPTPQQGALTWRLPGSGPPTPTRLRASKVDTNGVHQYASSPGRSPGHTHAHTRTRQAGHSHAARFGQGNVHRSDPCHSQIEPFDGWWSAVQPVLLLLRNCEGVGAQTAPKAIPDPLLEGNLAGWL